MASFMPGRMQHQLSRGFEFCGEIGQPESDGLVLDDGLAETPAIPSIAHGDVERRLGHADTLRSDADAADFKVR